LCFVATTKTPETSSVTGTTSITNTTITEPPPSPSEFWIGSSSRQMYNISYLFLEKTNLGLILGLTLGLGIPILLGTVAIIVYFCHKKGQSKYDAITTDKF
jgi:hypothetical protein